MQNSIWISIFLLLTGCAYVEPTPVNLSDVKNLPPHFVKECSIFDLSGKVHYQHFEKSCVFFNDGSLIAEAGRTVNAYDKSMALKWKRKFSYLHHTFRKSELADELLVLDSDPRALHNRNMRSDILYVLGLDGKVLKSAKFDTLIAAIEKMKFPIHAPQQTEWTKFLFENTHPTYDYSHVNSFYEFYETVNGKKRQTGYIIHCNLQKKIVVLDLELKKMIRVIDTGERDLHDVHQLNDNELIFFQNASRIPETWSGVAIGGYNMLTGKYFEIYRPSVKFQAFACSSVQDIGNNRLFITHSNCANQDREKWQAMLEYVNLADKKPVYFTFDAGIGVSRTELTDLTGFLKNNRGL